MYQNKRYIIKTAPLYHRRLKFYNLSKYKFVEYLLRPSLDEFSEK